MTHLGMPALDAAVASLAYELAVVMMVSASILVVTAFFHSGGGSDSSVTRERRTDLGCNGSQGETGCHSGSRVTPPDAITLIQSGPGLVRGGP